MLCHKIRIATMFAEVIVIECHSYIFNVWLLALFLTDDYLRALDYLHKFLQRYLSQLEFQSSSCVNRQKIYQQAHKVDRIIGEKTH